MTTEELAALLTAQTDIDFDETHLLGRRPWIFDTDKTYDEWGVAVARALLVDPISVQIVGSAATGYSLSPLKPGRPFRPSGSSVASVSDIDIAVIDTDLFAVAWDTILRLDRTHRLRGSHDTRLKMRVDVYWGVIGQQSLPPGTDPARSLLRAMAVAGRAPPLRGYRVRSRLYRRHEDLRAYHVSSLRQLRAALFS